MVKPFPLSIANRNNSQKGVRYVNLRLRSLSHHNTVFGHIDEGHLKEKKARKVSSLQNNQNKTMMLSIEKEY